MNPQIGVDRLPNEDGAVQPPLERHRVKRLLLVNIEPDGVVRFRLGLFHSSTYQEYPLRMILAS